MTSTLSTLRRIVPVAAVAGLLALASAAVADGPYTDTAGDSNGAPDIRTVDVSNDFDGQIIIQIDVDSLPSPSAFLTNVFLDTDRNRATGDPHEFGADYLLDVDQSDNSYGFGRWNGADWVGAVPSSTVSASTSPTGMTIRVNRSELGNTDAFDFWILLINPTDLEQHDVAPDVPTWSYTLATRPEIQAVTTVARPASGPHAGRTFTVTASSLRIAPTGTAAPPDGYDCTAKLGGKAITGKGTGRCTWQMPKRKVRGKRLVIALTATYRGVSKTVTRSYLVT